MFRKNDEKKNSGGKGLKLNFYIYGSLASMRLKSQTSKESLAYIEMITQYVLPVMHHNNRCSRLPSVLIFKYRNLNK